ncbi:MAG: hypothetical protein ACXABF_16455 [Candidatus Thorarchaeota archaeon]|jgi:hypothetical protein
MCFKKLWEMMVLGYTRNIIIEEFSQGRMTREEMLRRLDELDDE